MLSTVHQNKYHPLYSHKKHSQISEKKGSQVKDLSGFKQSKTNIENPSVYFNVLRNIKKNEFISFAEICERKIRKKFNLVIVILPSLNLRILWYFEQQ